MALSTRAISATGSGQVEVPGDPVGVGPGATRPLGVRPPAGRVGVGLGVGPGAAALVLQLPQRGALGLVQQPALRPRVGGRGPGDGFGLPGRQLAPRHRLGDHRQRLELAARLHQAPGVGLGRAGLAGQPVLRRPVAVGPPHRGVRHLGGGPGLEPVAEAFDPLARGR